jgi:hypothetical protein
MKIIELRDIVKKDIPLHYRNEYSAMAVLEFGQKKIPEEKKIEFVLERSATGAVDIQLNFLDELNYPLLPARKLLTDHIRNLDKRGILR